MPRTVFARGISLYTERVLILQGPNRLTYTGVFKA